MMGGGPIRYNPITDLSICKSTNHTRMDGRFGSVLQHLAVHLHLVLWVECCFVGDLMWENLYERIQTVHVGNEAIPRVQVKE